MLTLSSETKEEIRITAKDVAGTITSFDLGFSYQDMLGAALDLVSGVAKQEVDDAIAEYGFDSVLKLAGSFVPNYLPEITE